MTMLVLLFLCSDPRSWRVALVPYREPRSNGLARVPPGLSQPSRPSTLPRGPPRLRAREGWIGLEAGVCGEVRGTEVVGYSFASTKPGSQGVPCSQLPACLCLSLCSGCSCGYCSVQRPGVAEDHGMKSGRSVWQGQRWRDWSGCMWELLFQEAWSVLFSTAWGWA